MVLTEEFRKKLRYAVVSAIFVPIGQILIQIIGLGLHNYTVASLVQAAIITAPNFFANKHFVWRVTSRDHLRLQVFVFWISVMSGVALATYFTHLVEVATGDQTKLFRGVSVLVAQLFGLGLVWVARFLILDRWLFRPVGAVPDYAEDAVGEIPV